MSEVIYTDPRQRTHALHLGLWLFLGSETLLFAGLFGLYSAYRASFPLAFRTGIAHGNQLVGGANTAVLLVSSFCVAWAVHALRNDRPRTSKRALVIAIFLGCLFLVFKSIEYAGHLREGLAPGMYYSSLELTAPGSQLFFTLYYLMTGLHALHVIAGMAILGWLVVRIHRHKTRADHHTELELGGLYWHLVDVVWIFLWPLLYLTHQ
ncbi:MAG: cytochrome c oxidase subunit 3 family protein [Kofleriaceae bacterium]|nr:cytochrome c oxidase subunit 3 family protein [Kofleriaceae bacterium]